MKRRTRIQYTEADKALMWERWRQGESLHAIARLFDRYHPSIGGMLSDWWDAFKDRRDTTAAPVSLSVGLGFD